MDHHSALEPARWALLVSLVAKLACATEDAPGLVHEYTFTTGSDDGSQLFIDDQRMVDNSGILGMTKESGKAMMSAGDHAIRIACFQGTAGAACKVSRAAPGGVEVLILGTALVHTRGAEAKIAWDKAA